MIHHKGHRNSTLLVLLVLIALLGCTKIDTIMPCTIRSGSTWVTPVFKYKTRSDVLNVTVRFNETCLYDTLPTGCEGDWNKLIYLGTFNQHEDGAAFVWRRESYHIVIGYYLWLNGEAPFRTGRMHEIQAIELNRWYELEIILDDEVSWYVDNEKVMSYPYKIEGRWVSSGWFGGEDDAGHDCPAPSEMNYDMKVDRIRI